MEPADIQVRRLESRHDPAFQALIEIYIEAHSASARKSIGQLESMLRQPQYFFLVGIRSEQVLGFSITRAFDGSDAALLEYFAVRQDCRGHGIGSTLLRGTCDFAELGGKFLLAEVDSDKEATEDHAERVRRKQFYRRLGWREVAQLEYIMPPVSSSLPPAMDILVYARELPGWLGRERLKNWLERCYAEVYGQSADDPRIAAMIRDLPRQVPLL
ncbi:GNAT family N-acetyltransferase [Acidobacteria bacterium AB60]|nr:GNAT family N-acetyltransferase [Acidobacteria bacterium AB60]